MTVVFKMRQKINYILLIIFIVIAGGAYFMQKFSIACEKKQTYDFNVDVREIFLDGTKTWMIQDKTSKLVHMRFVFKNTGSAFEKKTGSLAVLESVIFEGAGDLDAYHFQEFLANHQISLDISFGIDDCAIAIQTPPQNLPHVLKALTLVFKNLRVDVEEFKRAKERLLIGFEQSKFEPNSLAADYYNDYAFEKHPYFVSIDDMIKAIKDVKSEDVKIALKNHFTKDRLACVLLGGFDEKTSEQFIKDVKNLFLEKSPLAQEIPLVTLKNEKTEKMFFMDVPQSIILFRMKGVSFTHPDFNALQVFNAILGGNSFTSKLWDEIREKRGLAYFVNTRLGGARYMEILKGSMGTSTQQVKQALEILKKVTQEVVEKGMTQKELDAQKRFFTGDFVTKFDSLSQMGSILSTYITDRPLEDLKNRNEKIKALTLEQVNGAAKKHFDYKNMTFCILGQNRD